MKSVIKIKNLSKVYKISHELKASPGTVTVRDTIANVIKKPIELITGHRLKKENLWALKDINLEVNQGDVIGIIGRNGSGKSTLLKILSRIVEPTKGEARMHGRVASLLEVGTGFHPELTGRENIYFNGAILGMRKKEIDAKFDEIVAFSEVEKFLDTPVKFYSSGMYVRLAFAVAAYLDPDILIVDEVLAVGDAAFQKKCLGKMKDVAESGRTVLFVSHNMASIQSLCNQAILLKDGLIIKTGLAGSVIREYIGRLSIKTAIYENFDHSTEGRQRIKINKILIYNSDGKLDPSLKFGKNVKIKLMLKKTDQIIHNIRVDLNIYNEDGIRLACLTSDKLIDLESNELLLSINHIPFSEGSYYGSISVLSDASILEDFIQEAFYFNVLASQQLIPGANNLIYKKITVQ